MKQKLFILIMLMFFILLLSACEAASVAPTFEDVMMTELHLNPATKGLENTLALCDLSIPDFDYYFYVSELQDTHTYFHFGEPQTDLSSLIPLAYDDFVILLHPNQPIDSLSKNQIQAVFGGTIGNWKKVGGNPGVIQVLVYAEGSELQNAFNQFFMQDRPITTKAMMLSSMEKMQSWIASETNAIGFMPASLAPEGLTTIQTNVRIPLLVERGVLELGASDKLLACLQSETMQILLLADFVANIE